MALVLFIVAAGAMCSLVCAPVLTGWGVQYVAALWVVGGTALAAGFAELEWRRSVHDAFAWSVVAGAVLLAAGSLVLPVLARRWTVAVGLVVTLLGWATAWFGVGLLLLPIGIALYGGGAVRSRVLPLRAALLGAALVVLGVLALWRLATPFVGAELLAAVPLVVGAGIYVRDSAVSR